MRHTLIAAVIAAVAAMWLSVGLTNIPASGEVEQPDPVQMTTTTIPYPSTPVAVVHVKPEPVVHAMRLAAIRESYLGLDIPAYPPVLAALRIEAMFDPIKLPPPPPPTTPIVRVNLRPADVLAPEYLRTLVEAVFEPEHVDLMLLVAWCESRWDTNAVNPSSGAAGLFQFMPGWFRGEWGLTGTFDPHDPVQAVDAAAKLLYQTSSGIGNWNPSRYCWGG